MCWSGSGLVIRVNRVEERGVNAEVVFFEPAV